LKRRLDVSLKCVISATKPSVSEVHDIEQLAIFLNDLIARADSLPPGRAKDFFLLVILLLFQAIL
jgi:hypothetical protein